MKKIFATLYIFLWVALVINPVFGQLNQQQLIDLYRSANTKYQAFGAPKLAELNSGRYKNDLYKTRKLIQELISIVAETGSSYKTYIEGCKRFRVAPQGVIQEANQMDGLKASLENNLNIVNHNIHVMETNSAINAAVDYWNARSKTISNLFDYYNSHFEEVMMKEKMDPVQYMGGLKDLKNKLQEIQNMYADCRGRFIAISHVEGTKLMDNNIIRLGPSIKSIDDKINEANKIAKDNYDNAGSAITSIEKLMDAESSYLKQAENHLLLIKKYDETILAARILDFKDQIRQLMAAKQSRLIKFYHAQALYCISQLEELKQQKSINLKVIKNVLDELVNVINKAKISYQELAQVDHQNNWFKNWPTSQMDQKINEFQEFLSQSYDINTLLSELEALITQSKESYLSNTAGDMLSVYNRMAVLIAEITQNNQILKRSDSIHDQAYWKELAHVELGEANLRDIYRKIELAYGNKEEVRLLAYLEESHNLLQTIQALRKSLINYARSQEGLKDYVLKHEEKLKVITNEQYILDEKLSEFVNRIKHDVAQKKIKENYIYHSPKSIMWDDERLFKNGNSHEVDSLNGIRGVAEKDEPNSRWVYPVFGGTNGGDRLYIGQRYQFKVKLPKITWVNVDSPTELNNASLRIKVFARGEIKDAKGNAVPLAQYDYVLPIVPDSKTTDQLGEAFKYWGDVYLNKNNSLFEIKGELMDRYGLITFFEYVTASSQRDYQEIILTHQATREEYTFLIEMRHNKAKVDVKSLGEESKNDGYASAYVITFNGATLEEVQYTSQPQFSNPSEPTEYNQRQLESRVTKGLVNPQSSPESGALKVLNNSPELRSHELLDAVVSRFENSPIALSNWVLNEIDLIQGSSLPRGANVDEGDQLLAGFGLSIHNKEVYPGIINRGALGVLLEKQGTPWEQCALLVYLLRKAGYKAAYAEMSKGGKLEVSLPTLSKMLKMQLKGYEERKSISLKYPWVVFYDEKSSKWIHIFPWLKEIEVVEGLNIDDHLPNGYKNVQEWITQYLQNNPSILGHIGRDKNDTALRLFLAGVEKNVNQRNLSLDDVGVQYIKRKRYAAKWEDLPQPEIIEGEFTIVEDISMREELFSKVTVEVFSNQNPDRKIGLGPINYAELHHRNLFVYFEPTTPDPKGKSYWMTLKLGNFSSATNTLGAQVQRVKVDEKDRNISITITFDGKIESNTYQMCMFDTTGLKQQTVTRPIDKGSTAAICVTYGRVTAEMLKLKVDDFNSNKASYSGYESQGVLCSILGTTYFHNVTKNSEIVNRLYKLTPTTVYGVGLAKLSPDLTVGSPNKSPEGYLIGIPDLRYPQVDMMFYEYDGYGNGTIRPDLNKPRGKAMYDAALLGIVDGSSWEHQVLNDVFQGDYAISTVKLLQLAHKRHTAKGMEGAGYIPVTQANVKDLLAGKLKEFSNIDQISKDLGSQWNEILKAFGYDAASGHLALDDIDMVNSIAYITPGRVCSDDGDINDPNRKPSYFGSGAFIFSPHQWQALISGNDLFNMNGGYGSKVGEFTFSEPKIKQSNIYFHSESVTATFTPGHTHNTQAQFAHASGIAEKFNSFASAQTQNANAYSGHVHGGSHYFASSGYSNPIPSITINPVNPVSGKPLIPIRTESIYDTPDAKIHRDEFKKNLPKQTLNQYNNDRAPFGFYSGEYAHADAENIYEWIYDKGALKPEVRPESKSIYDWVADPVDVASGAFYLAEEDLRISGLRDIVIKRNYNSRNPFPSDFGHGWKLSYNHYLSFEEKNGEHLLLVPETDGSVLVYSKKSGTTIWTIDFEKNPELSISSNNGNISAFGRAYVEEKIDSTSNTKSYIHCAADGSTKTYILRSFPIKDLKRERPYLDLWTDSSGRVLRFTYENEAKIDGKNNFSYGHLTRISNESGQSIKFAYNNRGFISSAQASDGRTVTYEYDQFDDLIKVTFPDDTTVAYEYEMSRDEGDKEDVVFSTHRLFREIKPEGFVLENFYDTKGRVLSQKTCYGFSNQTDHNAAFQYLASEAPNELKSVTLVYDPNNNVTTYQLYKGKIYKIIDPQGNVIENTWYITATTIFDPQDETIKTVEEVGIPFSLKQTKSKRGVVTEYHYDQQGNITDTVVKGEDLTGSGIQENKRTNVYEQKTPFRLLEERFSDGNGNNHILQYEYDTQYIFKPSQIRHLVNGTLIKKSVFAYGSDKNQQGQIIESIVFDKDEKLLSNTKFEYDEKGFLSAIHRLIDDLENYYTTKYIYNSLGLCTEEQYPHGDRVIYDYDVMGRRIATLHYNEKGEKVNQQYNHYYKNGKIKWKQGSQEDPINAEFHYYDNAQNLVSTVESEVAAVERNGKIQVDSVKQNHPYHGHFTINRYDELRNIVETINHRGFSKRFEHDSLGRLTKITESDRELDFEYEPEGIVSKENTNWGQEITYTHTTDGKTTSKTLSSGLTENWKYDLLGRVVNSSERDGTTTNVYDDVNGKVTTTFNGEVETRECDSAGRLIRYVDTRGGVYVYKYSYLGDCIEEMNSLGEMTQYIHIYKENLKKVVHPSKKSEHYLYDMLGRILIIRYFSAEGLLEEEIEYKYVADGYTQVEFKGNASPITKTINTYDQKGRLIARQVILETGRTLSEIYRYDGNGNLIAYKDFDGNWYEYQYDQYDQLLSEKRPDGTRIKYDYDIAGNRIKTYFPRGVSLLEEYDAKTRQMKSQKLQRRDIQERVFEYEIDNRHRIINKKDPRGIAIDYAYDSKNRLKTLISSNGEKITYEYYEGGLLKSILKEGQNTESTLIEFEYDANKHLVKECIYVGGILHQESNQQWNENKRTHLTLQVDEKRLESNFEYLTSGKLASLKVPAIGYSLNLGYIDNGALIRKEDNYYKWSLLGIDHDPKLPGASKTSINGQEIMREDMMWEANDRLSVYGLRISTDSNPSIKKFIYDEMNRLVNSFTYKSAQDLQKNEFTQADNYSYDVLGILQRRSLQNDLITKHYEVDQQYGNVVEVDRTLDQTEAKVCYNYNPRDLRKWLPELQNICLPTATGDNIREYDEAGNLEVFTHGETGKKYHLKWNSWGELVQVEVCNEFTWNALYDGKGRRLRTILVKNDGEKQQLDSYFDPLVEFLEIGIKRSETKPDSKLDTITKLFVTPEPKLNPIVWKIYGPDINGIYGGLQGIGGLQLIVNASTGKKVKPLQDMHGNIIGYFPVETGKESANIQRKSEESYDAYGPIISEGSILEEFSTEIDLSEVVAKAHTWRGKRVDPTGYIWMGTRYYEPGSGRFISPDPYGHEGSIDLYSYANGNPVYYCDADGRFASAVYEQAKENPVDAMQYGLDVAGMIPGIGIAPDLVNALVHSVRGNHMDAMISLAAAIPIVGDVGRGVNIASDTAKMAVKVGEEVIDLGYLTAKGLPTHTKTFKTFEVRAVRDLKHIDESTLKAMVEHGFAPTTLNGDKIILHHHQQNPKGFIVEMPATNHKIGNRNQHPFGNAAGSGLDTEQRNLFNQWRTDYWKNRAAEEIEKRGSL